MTRRCKDATGSLAGASSIFRKRKPTSSPGAQQIWVQLRFGSFRASWSLMAGSGLLGPAKRLTPSATSRSVIVVASTNRAWTDRAVRDRPPPLVLFVESAPAQRAADRCDHPARGYRPFLILCPSKPQRLCPEPERRTRRADVGGIWPNGRFQPARPAACATTSRWLRSSAAGSPTAGPDPKQQTARSWPSDGSTLGTVISCRGWEMDGAAEAATRWRAASDGSPLERRIRRHAMRPRYAPSSG